MVLSFVSSGAWMVTVLPPLSVARSLQLGTVAVWLMAVAWGGLGRLWLDRRIVWGSSAVLGSVLLSTLVAGAVFQTVFYDIFANMPLLLWLAFLAIFVLAASIRWTRTGVTWGLSAVLGFGTLLALVMAYQQTTTGQNHVFGSPAYGVTALAALIPVGVGLGLVGKGRWRMAAFLASAVIAASIAFRSGTTMGLLGSAFAIGASVLVIPAVLRAEKPGLKLVRWIIVAGLAVAVAALFALQMPALTGAWVNPATTAAFDRNVVDGGVNGAGGCAAASVPPVVSCSSGAPTGAP